MSDEYEGPAPGDYCDDCESRVASDGECECNQDDEEANP